MSDTITINAEAEQEIDADGADLDVTVQSSKLLTSSDALTNSDEIRLLIEVLAKVGIDQDQVSFRDVYARKQSFAGLRSSTIRYSLAILQVDTNNVPAVVSALASLKSVAVHQVHWTYSEQNALSRTLRSKAIHAALTNAATDAELIGVKLLGIQTMSTSSDVKQYHSNDVDGIIACFEEDEELLHEAAPIRSLGNKRRLRVSLECVFRVSEFGPEWIVPSQDY